MGLSVAGIWDLIRIMPRDPGICRRNCRICFLDTSQGFSEERGKIPGIGDCLCGPDPVAVLVEILFFYSRSNNLAGPFVRLTMLLYALNHFRIDLLETYYGLEKGRNWRKGFTEASRINDQSDKASFYL